MGRRGAPQGGPRPKNAGKVAKRLFKYITDGYKPQLTGVLIFILFSSGISVANSLFLRVLIDRYITPLMGVENPVLTGLMQAIGLMAGLFIVGVIMNYANSRLMVTISQGVQKTIRDEMFSHMQTLPIGYFDTNAHGDIMSRYTNDIDTLRQMLSQSIPQLLSSAITIVFVVASMLYLSIPLTLTVAVMVFFILRAMRLITGKSGSYFVGQQKSLGEINGFIQEMIGGQKVVKVFCHEQENKDSFDKLNEALCETATNANKYANVLMPIMAQLGNLQYVLVAILGGAMAVSGVAGLTLGTIASFLQLCRSFSMPLNQVSTQLNSVIMAMAGAGRIFDLLDEKSEIDEGTVTLVNATFAQDGTTLIESEKRTNLWAWKYPHEDGTVSYTQLQGDVRFFDVDFGYTPKKMVLEDITLYAKPGQKVAFVGATGAGKTTITNLINRFYDIDDGEIQYDGIDVKRIKKDDLRHSLGIVLQDTHLFSGTIRDNIRYGRLDASDADVERAAKLANADGFISRLHDGYDTVISGDGAALSQGQRQLLSIARATIADPPVMILDEATSSIDTRTETIVQRGMDALMKGRTVFVIAHRLSTIKNANAIMVLDHGRIMERGDHEELLEEKGMYYRLYTGDDDEIDHSTNRR